MYSNAYNSIHNNYVSVRMIISVHFPGTQIFLCVGRHHYQNRQLTHPKLRQYWATQIPMEERTGSKRDRELANPMAKSAYCKAIVTEVKIGEQNKTLKSWRFPLLSFGFSFHCNYNRFRAQTSAPLVCIWSPFGL